MGIGSSSVGRTGTWDVFEQTLYCTQRHTKRPICKYDVENLYLLCMYTDVLMLIYNSSVCLDQPDFLYFGPLCLQSRLSTTSPLLILVVPTGFRSAQAPVGSSFVGGRRVARGLLRLICVTTENRRTEERGRREKERSERFRFGRTRRKG